MKDMQSDTTTRPQGRPGGRNGRDRNSRRRGNGARGAPASGQAPLNTGLIHIPPFLAIILGLAGFSAGGISNVAQMWTSQNAAVIKLLTSDVYLHLLKTDPKHAASLIPTFNLCSWFLAICIQLGVIFFTLRVTQDFKEQLAHTQGKAISRIKSATKATAVEVTHQRDFLFYYGSACFIANCYGDYTFVWSFTDSVEFLIAWGLVLTATSTVIWAIGSEFLWAGFSAFMHAIAEWKGSYDAAYERAGGKQGRQRQEREEA
jgi:hypothetical protein